MADINIKIRVNRNKCCYCGACVASCPVPEGALTLEEVILKVNHNICIECGRCVQICPTGALSIIKNIKDDSAEIVRTNYVTNVMESRKYMERL